MNFLEIIKNSINNLCAKYIEGKLNDEILPIFYVAGSQTLPAPLEPKEEEEMIKKLETDEREYARKTLVERNLRLVVYIAKKFEKYRNRNRRLNIDWNNRLDEKCKYI